MMKYVLASLAIVAAVCIGPEVRASDVTEIAVEAAFEDVVQDLGDAIVNRGYKIDHRAYVGDMLARTADVVEGAKPIFKDAQLLQFCSAVLSRKAMEADPANIAYCPYVLFVYQRSDEDNKVRVGFRRLDEGGSEASRNAMSAINAVLQEMIEEAADQ